MGNEGDTLIANRDRMSVRALAGMKKRQTPGGGGNLNLQGVFRKRLKRALSHSEKEGRKAYLLPRGEFERTAGSGEWQMGEEAVTDWQK